MPEKAPRTRSEGDDSNKARDTCLVFAAGPASMAAAQPPTPQPLHYWHVWVDSAGMTHQTQCEFKDFSPLSLGKGVELIFVDKLQDTPDHVVIAQFPKGGRGMSRKSNKSEANGCLATRREHRRTTPVSGIVMSELEFINRTKLNFAGISDLISQGRGTSHE
jgi:hypothetical protein